MKWKEATNGAQGGSTGEATLENHCETPFCSWLERAPGENLTAISRAFVPPWSLIEDETGQLSDQTLQRSRNPSSPEDSVRKITSPLCTSPLAVNLSFGATLANSL